VFAGGARICRTWNFAALGGEYARADVAESLGRCVYRKLDSPWTEGKDGISSRPDDRSVR